LVSVGYLVVIVIYCYFRPLEGMPPRGEVRLIHFTPNFVSTFPIQVFAFTCAQNLFPLYNELKDNSQSQMNILVGTSIGSSILIYGGVALFGYLTFGSTVGANIMAMYPSRSLFVAFGQVAIVTLVLFSYPLQVHPCRNCLDKVFRPAQDHSPVKRIADMDDEEAEVEIDADVEPIYADMSSLKHAALTSAIVTTGFTIAYIVDSLEIVLSFVGSIGSTTVSFILPGLLFWKLTREDPNTSKTLNRSALLLSVYGMLVFVFCLAFNIHKVLYPSKP